MRTLLQAALLALGAVLLLGIVHNLLPILFPEYSRVITLFQRRERQDAMLPADAGEGTAPAALLSNGLSYDVSENSPTASRLVKYLSEASVPPHNVATKTEEESNRNDQSFSRSYRKLDSKSLPRKHEESEVHAREGHSSGSYADSSTGSSRDSSRGSSDKSYFRKKHEDTMNDKFRKPQEEKYKKYKHHLNYKPLTENRRKEEYRKEGHRVNGGRLQSQEQRRSNSESNSNEHSVNKNKFNTTQNRYKYYHCVICRMNRKHSPENRNIIFNNNNQYNNAKKIGSRRQSHDRGTNHNRGKNIKQGENYTRENAEGYKKNMKHASQRFLYNRKYAEENTHGNSYEQNGMNTAKLKKQDKESSDIFIDSESQTGKQENAESTILKKKRFFDHSHELSNHKNEESNMKDSVNQSKPVSKKNKGKTRLPKIFRKLICKKFKVYSKVNGINSTEEQGESAIPKSERGLPIEKLERKLLSKWDKSSSEEHSKNYESASEEKDSSREGESNLKSIRKLKDANKNCDNPNHSGSVRKDNEKRSYLFSISTSHPAPTRSGVEFYGKNENKNSVEIGSQEKVRFFDYHDKSVHNMNERRAKEREDNHKNSMKNPFMNGRQRRIGKCSHNEECTNTRTSQAVENSSWKGKNIANKNEGQENYSYVRRNKQYRLFDKIGDNTHRFHLSEKPSEPGNMKKDDRLQQKNFLEIGKHSLTHPRQRNKIINDQMSDLYRKKHSKLFLRRNPNGNELPVSDHSPCKCSISDFIQRLRVQVKPFRRRDGYRPVN